MNSRKGINAMKKLAVLILVLILAFAAMGAMAECEHQWEDGVCTVCGQVCAHNDKYVYTYSFDWGDESIKTTYVEIEGDNTNHTETTTGPCVVTYYCPVCCKYEDVNDPSYSATEERRHSYDSDGVCYNCGHKNDCTHPHVKEVIYVYTDGDEQYESISDYSHRKTGNGYKYTECEDCYQALTEYTYINDGSLTCEEEHYYYTEDGYPSVTCQYCGHTHTHDWDDYGNCSICNMHHDHEYDTSKADGVCTICGKNSCSHSYVYGVCSTCGFKCAHDWDAYGHCSICYMACYHESINEQEPKTESFTSYEYKNDKVHRIVEKTHDYRQCPVCAYKDVDYSTERTVSTIGTEAHTWEDGVCTVCQTTCSHQNLSKDKTIKQSEEMEWACVDARQHAKAILKKTYRKCENCGEEILVDTEIVDKDGETTEGHHYDENGYCDVCGYQCEHQYTDGVCANCGYACIHSFDSTKGKCWNCGYQCPHTNTYGAAEEEEYIWIDADKHQYRKYQKLYCNDCQSTAPVGTDVLEEREEAHTFNGDACSVCGYSRVSEISYTFNDTYGYSTLAINGSGAIPAYTSENPAPWADYSYADRIIIDKNITAIGANAFAGFDKPNLRVEFLQGSAPVIDENAFAGRADKVVCRYYSENGRWPSSNDKQTWIRLPYFLDVENSNDSHSLWYDGRWSLYVPDESGNNYHLYMTSEQVIEYSYDYRYLHLEAIPAANDPVIADWDSVVGISLSTKANTALAIQLSDASKLNSFDMSAPNATVTIANNTTNKTLNYILFSQGTLVYHGNVSRLSLEDHNGDRHDENSVTIDGNVGELKYYTLNTNCGYQGNLTVTGTITSGTIYGNQVIDHIPGIGDNVELSGTPGMTFTDVSQSTPIITDSVLTLTEENEAKLDGKAPDLDECGYRYRFAADLSGKDTFISFDLVPKAGGPDCAGHIENVLDINPDFSPKDIIYGANTYVDVGSHYPNKLVFDGKDGAGLCSVWISNSCQVVLNCPVNDISVNQDFHDNGPIDLTINDKLETILLILNNEKANTSIKLGKKGDISLGEWRRGRMGDRYFGPESGACDLYRDGRVAVMTRSTYMPTENTVAVLIPSPDDFAAVGVEGADMATSDDVELETDELDAVEAIVGKPDEASGEVSNVIGVVDISLYETTVDENGEKQQGEKITTLDQPISFEVSNYTGDFAYVLRLHEGDEGLEVTPLNDATARENMEVESDKFSKYVTVRAGERKHVHELSYAVNEAGDTITVTCANTDSGCGMPINGASGKNQVTLKITAPKLETEGDEASEKATLDGYEDFNAALGWNTVDTADKAISDASIVYTSSDGLTTYPEAPTTAGSYTATLTVNVDGQEPLNIKADYEINKNTPDYTLPEGLTGVYGDALSTVALPTEDPLGTWAWADDTTVMGDVGEQTFNAVFSAEGYDPLPVEVTVTVSAKPVTITGLSAENKAYDGTTDATPTGEATIEGKLENDVVTVKAGTAAFADANVGEGKEVTFADYALEGTDAAKYTLSAQPAGVTANITAKSIEGATVTLDNEKIEYTGSELSVTVQSVVLDEQTLNADTDYEVSGNTTGTDKGEYTVTVTGKGNYTGTATAKWKITDALMEVTAEDVNVPYDGAAHGIVVTVKAKKTQQPIESATISYGTVEGTYGEPASPTVTDVKGSPLTVYYQIVANGYETETGSATVTITPKTVNSPSITVAEGTYPYTGAAIEPTVTVKDGETEIPNSEYTVTYSNNTNAGTATVTIADAEGGNYAITETNKTFDIAPKTVSSPTITVAEGTYSYTGSAITPAVTVKDGETVIPDTEYTVGYSNNTNPGTATVTITDVEGGNYTVSGSTTFTIDKAANPAQLTATEASVIKGGNTVDLSDYVDKGAATGNISWAITGDNTIGSTITDSGILTSGDAMGSVTVAVTVAEDTYHKASENLEIQVTVTDKLTQTVSLAEDSISKTFGDAAFTNAATTNGNGTISYAVPQNTDVATVDVTTGEVTILKAGTVTITATATETSTYKEASASYTLTVDPKSIEDAVVTLDDTEKDYNETQQSVAVTSVKLDDTDLTANTDYTVSGVLSGTNAGEYTVTVTGQGNYTGTATTTWKIKGMAMTVSADDVSVDYDGNDHGIAVSVTLPAEGSTITYGESADNCTLEKSPTITNVADGPKTIYYQVTATNYEPVTGSATVTIRKVNATIATAPKAKADMTYTGTALALVEAGATDDGTLNYAVTTTNAVPADRDFAEAIPDKTDTGTYYIWYKVAADGNHIDTSPTMLQTPVKIVPVDKTALNAAIESAEAYYESIRENADYADIAKALKADIDVGKGLAANDNVTANAVSKAASDISEALNSAKTDVAAVEKKKADDAAAADAVKSAINNLNSDAGINDKAAVEAARAAYNKLTSDQKKLIDSSVLDKLDAAEQSVKAAEEAAARQAADKKAADAVKDAINNLNGDAGINDKAAVEAARAAYNSLTSEQKKLIDSSLLDKLEAAEQSVKAAEEEAARKAAEEEAARKAAEEAAAKQAADEAAAKSVADAIRALSDNAGLDDKDAVAAAKAAYDTLTEDQKKLIPGDVLSKLATAEQQVAAAEEAARTVDISACKITVKDLAYTGKKVKKPSVTVMYGSDKLTEGADYTFTYNKKAKAIGAYKLTVTGMGRYTGSVNTTFKVVPKGTAFSKLTGGDKQITLKWKSQKNITGYQIEYSLKKDFSSSKKVTVKKAKTLTTTIKKLKAGKAYYVRIRTYTTVKKKNYFSAWSKAKAVKTKAGKAKNNSTVPNIEVTMNVGEKLELSPLVAPDASDSVLTWITSDEAIATVSQDGVATALMPGEVVITATVDEGEQVRVTVRINEAEGVVLLDLGDNDLLLDVDDEFGEEIITVDGDTPVEIEEPAA